MKSNYDVVAPYYDLISRLVYGDVILNAHRYLVDAISANSSILIIGGGTGQILEDISKKYESGLQITYVDISIEMIERAKKRNSGNNKVCYINQAIVDVEISHQFDIVITPFFFDNFTDKTAEFILKKTDALLISGGLWMLADFQLSGKNYLWQKMLLNSMYFFFRIFCNIEASSLPDIRWVFEKNNYKAIAMKTFYKDFIYSVVYQKQ